MLDVGAIQKVEPWEFANDLDIECENKRGQDDQSFGLSDEKNGITIVKKEKTTKRGASDKRREGSGKFEKREDEK